MMLKSLATLSMAALICMSAEAQVFHLRQAEKMIPGTETLRFTSKSSAPDFVRFAKGSEISTSQAESWIRQNYGFTSNDALTGGKEEKDQIGMTHYRYGQKFNNIPVENGMVIVHSKNGKVVSINGTFIKGLQGGSSASLSEKVALKYATDNINASVYMWQIPGADAELQRIMKNPMLTYAPKGELVYVSGDGTCTPASYRLAYKFDIYASEPMSRNYVYVDASNGNILAKVDRIHNSDVSTTAETVYKGTQTITSDYTGSNYRLRETGRGNGVETYNLQQGTNYASAVDFTDADGYWNNVNAQLDQYATDAHLGTEKTYDYYYNTFGRNSIDNAGFSLISYVHYSTSYNNAFWNGSYMTYGDGDGSYFTPLMSVDVCGHEVTHGLTNFTANLVYSYESGALNESFSDIFGNCVEYYTDPGDFSWLLGEEITPSNAGIRDMSNPNVFSNPDTYHGTYWEYSSYDNGGVHINSGVQNYWFYLLTTGGSGTNDNGDPFSVSGIGISDAQAIAFRNLTVYLTSSSQFADAAFYANQAAIDLFGNNSNQQTQCNNAWYAVGVGSSTPPAEDPAPYCAVSYTVDCTDSDYINNFDFNTIANYNTGCTTLGYDNTGISTDVAPGQSYTFNASYSGIYNEALAIWIDFNFDNDFADAGEMVFNGSSASSHTGSITIPSNNASGTTRMRVSCAYGTSVTFPSDGCGYISYYGETEDYTINILDPYCAVSYDYGCQYGDYIDNFSFNTINEIGTGCSGNGYVLSTSTTSVEESQTYSFTTQYGYYSQGLAVYFDFNQDNDFADAGEMVFQDLNATSGHSGSITIPLGTPAGMHRMRVMCQYYPSSFPADGCGYVGYYGETQDYNIEVTLLPPSFPYCATSSTYGCQYGTNIDEFTFNTIQDIGSGCNNSSGYTNTGLSTTVTTGSTVTFTSAHYTYPMMVAIYMDMNQDNDFGDAGEMVFVDNYTYYTHSGNITIPTGTSVGPHRMRVLAVYDYLASIPADGCGYFGVYGEVQDYTVNVAANAGTDKALCTGNSTYMNADLPSGHTGLWTKIAGVGTIFTPTSPTTQIKNLTSGNSGTFVWSATNGIYTSEDTVVINRADIPSNITVTNVTPTTVTFSWTAAVDPDSFWVRLTENCTVSGAGQNFRVPGNVRSWTATGLKGCYNYCVKLRTQCPGPIYSAFSAPTSFNTTGPVACAVVNGYAVTGVQGCTYNVSWANGCVTADSFRVRYRLGSNAFTSSPFTTADNINLNLGVGTWEIRIQTWCNGVAVGLSPAGSYYTISNCSMPYAVSLAQNSNCNYRVTWQYCGASDSFRVRYRTGSNAYVNSAFTTNNYMDLNLAPGSWDFRIQNWCGNAVAGLTNAYNFNIASCRIAGAQEQVSNMVLFPNPTSDRSLLNFSSEVDGDYTLTLTDLSGRVLRTSAGTAVAGENTAEILVDGFAKGVYFVGLTLNGETRQIKLTVQ